MIFVRGQVELFNGAHQWKSLLKMTDLPGVFIVALLGVHKRGLKGSRIGSPSLSKLLKVIPMNPLLD